MRIVFVQPLRESLFEADVIPEMKPEEFDEIEEIRAVESPVTEMFKLFEVPWAVPYTELMRRIIHQLHQFPSFPDDGVAITPGENGRKESRDLDILFFTERVRYRNGVRCDEGGLIVFEGFPVQQCL